ncbi:MAG: hypothetical protein V7L23_18640 [Nostoc sp.]|uniref:hypothetical protein n=1 Tax=Nostoc sp. TaxID=1180 RepID=UPI002FF0EDC9
MRSRKGDGQWDFKGNDFSVEGRVMTGVKDEKTGKYYLIYTSHATYEGKDGSFEIAVKEKNADGKFAANKEKSEEQRLLWQKGHYTTTLLTDGVDNFTILAKVLSELKFVVKTPRPITAKYVMEQADKDALEVALSEYLAYFAVNGKPAPGSEIFQKARNVADNGVLVIPLSDEKELPRIEAKDMYGEVEAVNIETFPFTSANYPIIDKLGIELPVIPDANGKKSYGGSGGGATATATVTGYLSPQDRAKYIADSLRGMDVSVAGDDIAAIAKAIADAKPAKGENPVVELVKLAYQMTTDNWIL